MTIQTQPYNAPSVQEILLALLSQNTPVCFKAGGSSMMPTLRDGETVQVRPLRPGDLRCGAILLYQKTGDTPVLHRLVRTRSKSGSLLFTGDATLQGDDWVNPTNLLGIATGVQRAERTLSLDTRRQRMLGMLRYHVRPLRRLIWSWGHHAPPP